MQQDLKHIINRQLQASSLQEEIPPCSFIWEVPIPDLEEKVENKIKWGGIIVDIYKVLSHISDLIPLQSCVTNSIFQLKN